MDVYNKMGKERSFTLQAFNDFLIFFYLTRAAPSGASLTMWLVVGGNAFFRKIDVYLSDQNKYDKYFLKLSLHSQGALDLA